MNCKHCSAPVERSNKPGKNGYVCFECKRQNAKVRAKEQTERAKPIKLVLRAMPLTTNSLYAHVGKRRFMTSKGRTNKEEMGWEARTQYRGRPLEGALNAQISLWWPDKRNHDVDNIKSLLDAMTGILWNDDGQIQELSIKKGVDTQNSRVEIVVESLE